jgi:hypothetical protein
MDWALPLENLDDFLYDTKSIKSIFSIDKLKSYEWNPAENILRCFRRNI